MPEDDCIHPGGLYIEHGTPVEADSTFIAEADSTTVRVEGILADGFAEAYGLDGQQVEED